MVVGDAFSKGVLGLQNLDFNPVFPAEQWGYIRQIADKLPEIYGEHPKACVVTFGCQQNVSDSEKLKGMLDACGYICTGNMDEADFVIFNTCAVREHAQDRVYGNIGKVKALKKAKPRLIAAVCGCMAQQQIVADKIRKSYPYIDIVFGTQMFHRLPEFIYKRLNGHSRIFELSLPNDEILEDIPELAYYAPEYRTSPPYITLPVAQSGIPTIVYETYSYEDMDVTYELSRKLVECVDHLEFK